MYEANLYSLTLDPEPGVERGGVGCKMEVLIPEER